jgi:hypothetical protein
MQLDGGRERRVKDFGGNLIERDVTDILKCL